MAQAAGLSFTYGAARNSSVRRIRDLMPWIVEAIGRDHPGFTVARTSRTGLAEVIDDSDRATLIVIARMHQMITKLDRVNSEAGPMRASANPAQQQMAAFVLMMANLGASVEQPMEAEAERLLRTERATSNGQG